MTAYDPGRLHEGAVLLCGYVPGAGLTMFRSEDEAVAWATEPDGHGNRRKCPGRQVVRFQAAQLEFLSVVLPPPPWLDAA